jgi:hypothetical protein
MKIAFGIALISLTLRGVSLNAQIVSEGITLAYSEIERKPIAFDYQSVFLQNDFGKAKIFNAYILPRHLIPTEIEVVFSQYPQDTTRWLAILLSQRIRELLTLKPEWKSEPIRWKITIQTACTDYPCAKNLPHGFLIKYDRPIFDPDTPAPLSQNNIDEETGKPNAPGISQSIPNHHSSTPTTISLPGAFSKKEKISIEIESENTNFVQRDANNREYKDQRKEDPGRVRRTDRGSFSDKESEENNNNRKEANFNENKSSEKEGQTKNENLAPIKEGNNNLSPAKNSDKNNGLVTKEEIPTKDASISAEESLKNNKTLYKNSANAPEPASGNNNNNKESPGALSNAASDKEEAKENIQSGVKIAASDLTNKKQEADRKIPVSQQKDLDYLGISEEEKIKARKELARQSMNMIRGIINGDYPLPPQDSVVLKTFARHPEWKGLMVITDWTGSMYQYGAQVLKWHKQNIEKGTIKHLVLFNDGDDFEKNYSNFGQTKKMGETGGIYFCDPTDLEEVMQMMEMVMLRGDGGEIPENDIEAILKGIERYKGTYSSIVLIADNASEVRDINLLYKLKQPVHIIICGDVANIHPDYVAIAWKTGGSIMTIDYEVLFKGPESPLKKNTIKVGKNKYVLTSPLGRFDIKPKTSFLDKFRNSKKMYY